MAKQRRSVLKGYFQKGKVPTEEHFSDLIDSLVVLDEDGLSISGNGRVGIGTESPAAKLHVSGSVIATEFQGSGQGLTSLNVQNLQGQITSAQIQNLDAAKLTGQIPSEQIPDLNANQIKSGTIDQDRIPDLSASKISGVLAINQLPPLDASLISSGVFVVDRIPNLPQEKIIGLADLVAVIPRRGRLRFSLDKLSIDRNEAATVTASCPGSNCITVESAEKIDMSWIDSEQEVTFQLSPAVTSFYIITAYELTADRDLEVLDQKQFILRVLDRTPDLPQEESDESQDRKGLHFYIDKSIINSGQIATLKFLSPGSSRITLEYIADNKMQLSEWTKDLDQEQAHLLKPSETSLYTITAYQQEAIQEQRQFTIQVLLSEAQSLVHQRIKTWLDKKDEDAIIYLRRFLDEKIVADKIASAEHQKQPHQIVVPDLVGRNIQELSTLNRPELSFSYQWSDRSVFSSSSYEGDDYYPLTAADKSLFSNLYGKIYRQSPEAGTIVEPGTTIYVWYISD